MTIEVAALVLKYTILPVFEVLVSPVVCTLVRVNKLFEI